MDLKLTNKLALVTGSTKPKVLDVRLLKVLRPKVPMLLLMAELRMLWIK